MSCFFLATLDIVVKFQPYGLVVRCINTVIYIFEATRSDGSTERLLFGGYR